MPPETITPPIDRPLSATYLQAFTGWSTAYGPALADGTSFRQMENVLIGRDGSACIRPALRLMFDAHIDPSAQLVGSFEQFYGQSGKQILGAARDMSDGTVFFYTADYDGEVYENFDVPADTPVLDPATTYVKYLQINNRIYCLSNSGEDDVAVFNTNTGAFVTDVAYGDTRPATPTLTLQNLSAGDYNYGFFYTVVNEFGESMPSDIAHITADKKWTGWDAGDTIEVSGLPNDWRWNLYFVFWSSDAPVPVEGILVEGEGTGTTWIADSSSLLKSGGGSSHMLPSEADQDFTKPPRCSQGLVAADRLILVNDYENRARIRWSSNEAGYYGSFSPGRGGGYKTLSSGNLQIPYTVKLWQNPQSVDTITVLCAGIDGYHTSYYMAPATVISQNEELIIMGFEETTATPGTVSPYGCEVFNNALYHPLDDQLMKSSTNNYNIFHKTMSDAIAPNWLNLINKINIVSSEFDGRLYYIVHNPDGEPLEDGCMGNEIWVCDVGTGEGQLWSRFLIQAASLRKLESRGRLYMGVVRPEGIYRLDELQWMDQWADGERAIPWFFQTNTNGANKALDGYVDLHQVNPTFGDAYGTIRYGIQGWTEHGKPLDISKVYRQHIDIEPGRELPFDHEDKLLIQRRLHQWFFSAGSVVDHETKEVRPSFGRINKVAFMFTPATRNVGYELGSVQTMEYAHANNVWTDRTSINGIPIPELDPRRP